MVNRTSYLSRFGYNAQIQDVAKGYIAFLCLVGFIATQGYLIPVVALPYNWAVWPSLPDIFGVGLVVSVFVSQRHNKVSPFNQRTLKDLVFMGILFAANYVLVTNTFSMTGEGKKFGGYSLIVFFKLLVVYWAAIHVPMTPHRIRILHVAALAAFTNHLPRSRAGKWGAIEIDSTVSATHGGTTVTILVLGALAIGTAKHRFAWLVETLVFSLTITSSFITGSRQGLVRILTFIATCIVKKPGRYISLMVVLLSFLSLVSLLWGSSLSGYRENPYYLQALARQEVLRADPFSNEGLAGRPQLWSNVIDTLNEDPIRWIVGYGMGNYVEYNNSAHNMFLQYLQDGGIILLICCSALWIRIVYRIWHIRDRAWSLWALTLAMLSSIFTSTIFYPSLSTGWYLGLYFVTMHILEDIDV
jgi:hypothetical protein